MNENLKIYELGREVPQTAQKEIKAGRLKGFTDINPVWRIKKLTELFGPCGIGWWYVIKDKRLEVDEQTQQVAAFVDIDLYYILDGKVSMPVPGTGGSMFSSKESRGVYTDDECYKKALTDAIGVAAKALGIGADIYWDKDSSKYSPKGNDDEAPKKPKQDYSSGAFTPKCAACDEELTPAEHDYSVKNYGRPLCRNCQQAVGSSEPLKPVEPAVYMCNKCGNEVKPYVSVKTSKEVTAEQHAAITLARYKTVLCRKCASEHERKLKALEDYGKKLGEEK